MRGRCGSAATFTQTYNRSGNLIIENLVGSFLCFPLRCSRLIVISSGQSTTRARGRAPAERRYNKKFSFIKLIVHSSNIFPLRIDSSVQATSRRLRRVAAIFYTLPIKPCSSMVSQQRKGKANAPHYRRAVVSQMKCLLSHNLNHGSLAVRLTKVFGIAKAPEIVAGHSRHQHVSVSQPFRGLLV